MSARTATEVISPLAKKGMPLPRSHVARTVFCGICAALAAIAFFTPNGVLTSAAFLVLPFLAFLTWREGEPPVLLLGCCYQWMQATAATFYTNHYGQTLDEAFGSTALAIATWLSIIAVVVLAIGIRCGFIGAISTRAELESDASKVDIRKVAILYGVSVVFAGVLHLVAWRLPSITQPILALASVKWAVVFLLCSTVLHQRHGYGFLFGCLGLEFAMGLFGIFADFKNAFFVLVVATMSSPLALRGRRLGVSIISFLTLFVLGVTWTAIKTDYREFLANADTANEEAIPIERKFGKLADLVKDLTWDNFTDGLDALILRVSYVNYFALTVENVPARVPFENGELWKGSVIHVLTPRFLFPNKPVLDDSERTRLYSGVQVSGMESGSSIGIGYVGESYVDFGRFWMFAPIFLLGLLYGLINRFFLTRTRYKLLGSAFAVAILVFNAYAIETSNIKLVGGVISVALVSVVIYNLCGRRIANFLNQSPVREASVRQLPAETHIL